VFGLTENIIRKINEKINSKLQPIPERMPDKREMGSLFYSNFFIQTIAGPFRL